MTHSPEIIRSPGGRTRRRRGRQSGIALIVATVTIAVLGAVLGDFAFNARVDLEAAANARDQLRAEYLARSGIQLSRLLIKTQQAVIDPARKYIGDMQITDFVPYIIPAFGGDADERAGLGAMLGVDTGALKGLGVGKGARFDVIMAHEDGKLNINCGGGLNDVPHQQMIYGVLQSLFWPPRYNRMFERPDVDGQINTREDVARAMVDWADVDESRFEPPPATSSSSPEDYRYDAGRDPYKAHNQFYDTLEELNLVRGVGDDFWGSFGELFTVYGGCKVNLGAIKSENWPLMAGIIRATVKDDHKNDPVLLDDVLLAQAAQAVLGLAQMSGGFTSTNQFVQMINDPAKALQNITSNQNSNSSASSASASQVSGSTPVPLDNAKLNNIATIGPRRIYRLDSTGIIQRTREKKIQVHIRAIWDSQHFNQNTTSPDINDRMGTWVYWRED